MRLFVVGESRFGARFFRAAAREHEIVAVASSARPGAIGPLEAAAAAAGVPCVPFEPILAGHDGSVRSSGAELLVLANVSRIVPAAVLDSCRRGAVCFHPSLLPRHRGRHAVKDAVRAGDSFTGVTIFRPDAGADTGPIILQARVAIAPDETPSALYHDKLVPIGVFCMLAAIAAVEAGCAPSIAQEVA